MKSSHFSGGKVTEPKVKSYGRPLHVDMESYRKSVLSDAWSSYDRAKSTFNHVDSKVNEEEVERQSNNQHSYGRLPSSSSNKGRLPSSSKGLGNEHHQSTAGRPTVNKSLSNDNITTTTTTTTNRPTGISYSHSWATKPTSVPMDSSELISSVYRGPSPYTRETHVDTSQLLSSVYRGPSPRSTPYNNSVSSYQPSSGHYMQQHRETITDSSHTHSIKPMTRKTRSASGRTDTHVSQGVEPKLKLPQETVSTLYETIERQKRELDDLADRRAKQQNQFNSYTSRANKHINVTTPTVRVPSAEQPAPMKRRKIATAPLPKSYAGFTSTLQGPPTLRPRSSQHHSTTTITTATSRVMPRHEQPKFEVPCPPLITPSSWRSGQENVDRIIGKRIPLSKQLPAKKPSLPTTINGYLGSQRSSNASMLLHELERNNDDNYDDDDDNDDDNDNGDDRENYNGVKDGHKRDEPSSVAIKLRRILDSDNTEDPSMTATKIVEKHYDRDAVRKYMKAKEEEKRRQVREEKITQQRAQDERERRLKDLQDRQRQILVSNLLHQKRQRNDHPTTATSDYHRDYYSHDESKYYSSYTSPLVHAVPLLSPPSISPLHTPVSTPRTPHLTSPIRYNATTPSPRININFTTPPISSHPLSHTPTHPLSHTPTPVPTSVYLSPYAVNTGVQTGTSPTPSVTSSITPPYSPIREPLSSSVSSSHGSPRRTPVSDHHQARILALKQSAIALREKIIAQRHVMSEKGMYSPIRTTDIISSQRLPGVSNIHHHATSLLTRQQQEEAATKIQSVWKGYRERKNAFTESVKPVTPVTSPLVLPSAVQTTPRVQVTPPTTRPTMGMTHFHSPLNTSAVLKTTTPLQKTSPWLQEGGDRYSVVNIYARRQEQLKQLLDECPISTSIGACPISTSIGACPTVSTSMGAFPPVLTITSIGTCPTVSTSMGMSPTVSTSMGMSPTVSTSIGMSPTVSTSMGTSHTVSTSIGMSPTVSTSIGVCPSSGWVCPPVGVSTETVVNELSYSDNSSEEDNGGGKEEENGKDEVDEDGIMSSCCSSPDISAITPPGSSSFNESFVTPPLYHPKTQPINGDIPQGGRFSPHSLEVKLKAELNVLEAVGEGVRQLEGVESTRAVSLAQQETVALAALLKSQKQIHQSDIHGVTNKAKKESEQVQREFMKLSEEANKMSERLKEFEERSKQESERHKQEMKTVRAVSCQKVNDITEQLLTTQSVVTSTLVNITEKQLQSAHDMAVGVAKTAAQEAVISALKENQPTNTTTMSYKSDFEESLQQESTTATLTPINASSLAPPTSTPVSTPHSKLSPVCSTRSQSLTPVPSEKSHHGEEEDHTVTEGTITEGGSDIEQDEGEDTILTEENNEEEFSTTGEVSEEISHIVEDGEDGESISETSFRELLPSESHRRKHRRTRSSPHHNDDCNQPLMLSGDMSPVSGNGGDESFLDFMSRMLHQYTKEEEMRAKHQSTLLELREKAIKEKTEAQLKWLKIKKGQVQKRGDDLAMPPLLKREKGILKQLQHEQAEIQRLKEVHRTASNERRLFLLQQQDISRINRSAHYYKDKIRKYGAHNSREQSPYPDLSPSPSPSIYFSQEDIHYSSSSLNTSPNKSLSHSTTSIPDMISHSPETTPTTLPHQAIPVLKSSTTAGDPDTLKLRQKSAQDAEKLLNKRTEQLIKRRKKAEDLLRAEQDIMKRKKELDEEEERITLILEQAKGYHKQIGVKSNKPSLTLSATPINTLTTPTNTPTVPLDLSLTIHEQLTPTNMSSNIPEDILHSTLYDTNSFDSVTKSRSTSQTNGVLDDETSEIEQFKKQLRLKELELKERKIKHENILRTTQQQQQQQQQQQTLNQSLTETSLPKTELATPTKDDLTNDKVEATPTDVNLDLLSPISSGGVSSASSASTVISTAIEDSSIRNSSSSSKDASILKENDTGLEDKPHGVLKEDVGVTSSSGDEISEDLEQETDQSGVLSPIPVEQEPDQKQESGHSGVSSPIPVEQESDHSGMLSPISVEQESDHSGVLSPIPVEQESGHSGVLSPIPVEQESNQSPIEAQREQTSGPVLGPLVFPSASLNDTKHIVGGVSNDLTIGTRVLVGNKVEGTVQYIGETEFDKGVWIGVELDYEKGKNDGSVNGKRYFTCSPKYGIFAPPTKVIPLKSEVMLSDSEASDCSNHDDISEAQGEGVINDVTLTTKENNNKVTQVTPVNEVTPVIDVSDGSHHENESELATNGDMENHSYVKPATHILAIKKDVDIPVNDVAEELLRQLTTEAFGTVHSIWKAKDTATTSLEKVEDEKKKEERGKEQVVDNITNDILKALVTAEVSVICNIRAAKNTEEVENKSEGTTARRKTTSFSSEPLSLVPCSKEAINDITIAAWSAVNSDAPIPGSPPPNVIATHCTMSSGPMLECQVSFAKFVYQLAIEVINNHKTSCSNVPKSLASHFHKKSLTLRQIQSDVFTKIHQCKHPVKLLSPRYLAGNCRLGGKMIDGVDLLLIKELREEEPLWVNYDKDEEQVKIRTADEILDLLINETVTVLNNIYRKKALAQ